MTSRLRRPGRPRARPIGSDESVGIPDKVAGIGDLVILGIDPSLRGTGWGVIRWDPRSPIALGCGTIGCPAGWPRTRCLVRIASSLREAIRLHRPGVCAVEGLFYAQNLQTALLMGEARGVCLLAAAEAGLEVFELAPRRVKQAVVGFGGAQKIAVARMVQRRLGLEEPPSADAADALALALAYGQESGNPLRACRRAL
ncbi:MAG: crossover junction endodeoxyribonuclease RuvC [Limisphaerales bacterium]